MTFRTVTRCGLWASAVAALVMSSAAAAQTSAASTGSPAVSGPIAGPATAGRTLGGSAARSPVRVASENARQPASGGSFLQPPAAKPWSVMLYGGVGSRSNLEEVLLSDIHFVGSQFIGGVLNREMFRFFRRHFSFELEAQAIGHTGRQDNGEFNGLYVLRLNTFPWDRHVDTSFAVGQGLSYATGIPAIEAEDHPGETSRFLHYLMFELAFGLPEYPQWSLATRIHHRSGVFGLFNGAKGGSNFLAAGLRYNF